MKNFILFITCFIASVVADAQTNYAEAIRQGDDAFSIKEYKTAINKYFAAEAFDPSKKDEVKVKVNRVFDRIEALRAEVRQAQTTTDSAYRQAQKLTDAFYFYKDRFALAAGGDADKREYYFIDRQGNKIEKLGVDWTKASQFDETTGFAKVTSKEGLLDYLLDTLLSRRGFHLVHFK